MNMIIKSFGLKTDKIQVYDAVSVNIVKKC